MRNTTLQASIKVAVAAICGVCFSSVPAVGETPEGERDAHSRFQRIFFTYPDQPTVNYSSTGTIQGQDHVTVQATQFATRGAYSYQPTVVAPVTSAPVVEINLAPRPATANYYVQAGAFSVLENAQRLQSSLSQSEVATIQPATVRGLRLYRVVIGPIASRAQAINKRQVLLTGGTLSAAFIVKVDG